MSHTEEPWNQHTHGIQPATHFKQVPPEDYIRATRCVNACAGIEAPHKFIQDSKDRIMEEEKFNRAADQAIKDTENAREYLINEGIDPDEVGKMGATFVRLLMEKTKAEAKLAQLSCMMGVGEGSGRLFVHGNYESIKAAQLIVDQRDQAWKDDKEIREILGADENESTVDEVQSLLLNYRRAKDQMYKVRALIDGCADEFTELVNLVRPGEPEEVRFDINESNAAKEEEVNLIAGLLKEASQEIKNLPELVKTVVTDGIKIRVRKNEDGEIQIYSNLPGKYFDVGGYIKEFAEVKLLHRID